MFRFQSAQGIQSQADIKHSGESVLPAKNHHPGGLFGSLCADCVIRMVNVKDIYDLRTGLRGEMGDRKTGGFKGKIETLALALQSKRRAIKKKHAECLTEFNRLKRKSQDMEISHTQALAAIQERHRAAQVRYDTAQTRYRAQMVKTTVSNNAYPADERALKMLETAQYQQWKRMDVLAIILEAILFGGGIVAVLIFLLNKQ
jgi:hypothetical protein